jgi:hypothetical protein
MIRQMHDRRTLMMEEKENKDKEGLRKSNDNSKWSGALQKIKAGRDFEVNGLLR